MAMASDVLRIFLLLFWLFFCVSQMTVYYGCDGTMGPTDMKLVRAVAAAPALRFSADRDGETQRVQSIFLA